MSRRRKILYAIAIAGIVQYFAAMKLAARLPWEPGELDDDDDAGVTIPVDVLDDVGEGE